jgi:hypothetical protein
MARPFLSPSSYNQRNCSFTRTGSVDRVQWGPANYVESPYGNDTVPVTEKKWLQERKATTRSNCLHLLLWGVARLTGLSRLNKLWNSNYAHSQRKLCKRDSIFYIRKCEGGVNY